MKKSIKIGILLCSIIAFQYIASSKLGEATTFFKGFIKNRKEVGALFPCSSYTGEEITKYLKYNIRLNPNKPLRILEVGAGTGSLTQVILQKMRDIDHLDAVEISSDFCTTLQEKFGKISNISIHCCSITGWNPEYEYDIIISTLPFVTFESKLMDEIIEHFKKLIKSNGILSFVSYVGASQLKSIYLRGKEKKEYDAKAKRLKDFRKQYELEANTVLQNAPPIRIYHLRIGK